MCGLGVSAISRCWEKKKKTSIFKLPLCKKKEEEEEEKPTVLHVCVCVPRVCTCVFFTCVCVCVEGMQRGLVKNAQNVPLRLLLVGREQFP